MTVHQINSRRLFADFVPRAPQLVPEGTSFTASLVGSLLLPATGLSVTVESPIVLIVMIAVLTLGVLLGLLSYDPSPATPLSCVPVYQKPTAPAQEKKAA